MIQLLPEITNPAENNICHTCGTRYGDNVPLKCPVCADDRQYIPVTGQRWTNYHQLKNISAIRVDKLLPDVYTLRVVPAFAIAQKAHLICSPSGNLLWDCLPFIDEPTVAFIRSIGGLKGIAISHPHYYGLMSEWAKTFDCPIYLHEADKEWVMDKNPHIEFWSGQKYALWDDMEIVHTAGHFPGSTILHTPHVGNGGSLFVGDSLYIAPSFKFISMMHSYPNNIPLLKNDVQYISEQVSPISFDSMYGAFEWQNMHSGAKALFLNSVDAYLDIYR
jgi:hypothetical protein